MAQPAALRAMPQVVELQRFVAAAASAKLILFLYMAGLADVRPCGEVSQLPLLRAPGASRGRGARWHLHTDGAHPQRAEADAHVVQIGDVVPIHTVASAGNMRLQSLQRYVGPDFCRWTRPASHSTIIVLYSFMASEGL